MKAVDLTGKTFGEWTVLGRAKNRGKLLYWTCKCTCGEVKEVQGSSLKRGGSKSCRVWAGFFRRKHTGPLEVNRT